MTRELADLFDLALPESFQKRAHELRRREKLVIVGAKNDQKKLGCEP
jgi:hypothetical protein